MTEEELLDRLGGIANQLNQIAQESDDALKAATAVVAPKEDEKEKKAGELFSQLLVASFKKTKKKRK